MLTLILFQLQFSLIIVSDPAEDHKLCVQPYFENRIYEII